MPVNVFDLAGYTPNLSNTNPSIYLAQLTHCYSKNQKMIGRVQYSTQNQKHPNLGSNIIENRPLTASYSRLTIRYSQSIGKNITDGKTSGIVTAKKMTKTDCVIATTMNHPQNAATGRHYLSRWSDFTIHYFHYLVYSNDQLWNFIEAIYAHALLYILAE